MCKIKTTVDLAGEDLAGVSGNRLLTGTLPCFEKSSNWRTFHGKGWSMCVCVFLDCLKVATSDDEKPLDCLLRAQYLRLYQVLTFWGP